jgi:hypothetical protein
MHQFYVQNKQFITYLLVLADHHLPGGLLHLQRFVFWTIHKTVKNSAQQRLIYGCNFVPNSTLRLLCCMSAITVYALFQVSPQVEIWTRQVRRPCVKMLFFAH